MVESEKTQQLDQIPLYRYLTFNRFLETLDKGLFIPKASLFEDRWEAMMHWMHVYLEERNAEQMLLSAGHEAKVPTLSEYCITETHKNIYEGKKEVYVSCWNRSDHECVAMWKVYGKDKNAVMLETNAKELTDAFDDFDNSKEWMACLTELDYVLPGDRRYDKVLNGKEPIWQNDFAGGFLTFRFHCTFGGLQYKHISYAFENEYRLLAAHKERGERQNNGIVLPLRKSSFIKRVILQPDSSDIFKDIVQDCLKKNNFSDVPVEKSFLDELPPLEG